MAGLLPLLALFASTRVLAGASGGLTYNGGGYAGFLTRPGPLAIIVLVVALAALALYRSRRK